MEVLHFVSSRFFLAVLCFAGHRHAHGFGLQFGHLFFERFAITVLDTWPC